MVNTFQRDNTDLTLIPGSSVHNKTGEIEDIDLGRCVELVNKRVVSALEYKFINQVKDITGPLAEKVACKALGLKKVNVTNNKGHDAIGPNGEENEIKMGRIGNAAVIKSKQLDFLNLDGFYNLVFYRTKKNIAP